MSKANLAARYAATSIELSGSKSRDLFVHPIFEDMYTGTKEKFLLTSELMLLQHLR